MPSLRDEVAALGRPRRLQCSVKTFVDSRPIDEDWADLLDDTSIMSSHIWALMQKRGATFGQGTVQRHRRKSCSCVGA